MSCYRGRLSAQNWISSRQLQQSSAPLGETEEMAELPYMTYSSVQCDESQTTKGQHWQLSLIVPSVHLDAETGCVMCACGNQKCIILNHIHTYFKRTVLLVKYLLKIDQDCYTLQSLLYNIYDINENTVYSSFSEGHTHQPYQVWFPVSVCISGSFRYMCKFIIILYFHVFYYIFLSSLLPSLTEDSAA